MARDEAVNQTGGRWAPAPDISSLSSQRSVPVGKKFSFMTTANSLSASDGWIRSSERSAALAEKWQETQGCKG